VFSFTGSISREALNSIFFFNEKASKSLKAILIMTCSHVYVRKVSAVAQGADKKRTAYRILSLFQSERVFQKDLEKIKRK